LAIRHATSWFLTLADEFKGYLNCLVLNTIRKKNTTWRLQILVNSTGWYESGRYGTNHQEQISATSGQIYRLPTVTIAKKER
jgi:hypothetical protein